MTRPAKQPPEQVLKEWPAVGKYRVRLVHDGRRGGQALDVREFIKSEDFEGFTRRGIRISVEQCRQLEEVLREVQG